MKTLDEILQDATAGDPISGLKWTRKTARNLAEELKHKGFQVEHSTIPRLVRTLKYTLRSNQNASVENRMKDATNRCAI